MQRWLFVPWSVQLIDGQAPLDARQGACARQVPRYLSVRMEEAEGLDVQFAPYCAENEEGLMFVVSGCMQKTEELREIGVQYGVDVVVSGMALFGEQVEVTLQTVDVHSGEAVEQTIHAQAGLYRELLAEILHVLLNRFAPEAEPPASFACRELPRRFEAAAPFFCAIDRLMGVKVGVLDDDPPAVFELLFEALEQEPDWQDAREQVISTALEYGLNGDGLLDCAVDALERLVLLHPDQQKAWEALGYLYDKAMRSADAIICLEQAVFLDPLQFASHHRLGSLYRRGGEGGKAEQMFRLGLAQEPDHILMLNELGVLLGERGLHEEAAGCFRRLVGLSPISGAFYANLGAALYRLQRIAEAEEAFQAGVRAVDPHWNLFLNYAHFLKERGDALAFVHVLFQGISTLEKQEERLDLATRLIDAMREWMGEDALPEAVRAKGDAWAVGLMESLQELLPEHQSSAVVLAELYRRTGRQERALECLVRVESQDPENVWLKLHIGTLLSSLGRYDEAFERFLAAVEQNEAH